MLKPRQTTPQEFENGVSTLTKHQMFCVNTAPEEYEKKSQAKICHDYCNAIVYEKSFVFKMFTVQTKTQRRRFQIPPV